MIYEQHRKSDRDLRRSRALVGSDQKAVIGALDTQLFAKDSFNEELQAILSRISDKWLGMQLIR